MHPCLLCLHNSQIIMRHRLGRAAVLRYNFDQMGECNRDFVVSMFYIGGVFRKGVCVCWEGLWLQEGMPVQCYLKYGTGVSDWRDYMYYIYPGGQCFSTMEPLAFSGFK